MNLRSALGKSCNVFFYTLGVRLEVDRIAHYARKLGLGEATGIDLPSEASGLIPDPAWKARVQKAPWYPGETVSVAIGQGQVTTTALQLARLVGAAVTGKLARPHLVKSLGDSPRTWDEPVDLKLRPETLAALREGLGAVVEPGGTGWRAGVPGITVAGKTGSAQVVASAKLARSGDEEAFQPHGWFVAVAPLENPQIAVAVIVEHGGSGGLAAAPVAHEILASFFKVPPRPASPAPAPPPVASPEEVIG